MTKTYENKWYEVARRDGLYPLMERPQTLAGAIVYAKGTNAKAMANGYPHEDFSIFFCTIKRIVVDGVLQKETSQRTYVCDVKDGE